MTSSQQQDYYQILGVPRDALPDEIRQAYREAARRLHPDVNPDNPEAAETFILLQNAYEILSNPTERLKYDQHLRPELEELGYQASYSRSSLPPLDEEQLSYVLLEFSAPPAAHNTPPPPVNLCLVVDVSTSMGGSRLDVVKSTAISLIRQLKPSDRISLVTFSDHAEVILTGWQSGQPGDVETDIRMLRASGGTEIYQGLEAGYKLVRRYFNPQHINHIVLLTDGRTYGDEERCLSLAREARQHGIGISSLGIGDQWNDAFLDKLSDITGGSTTLVMRPADIKNYLQEKFSALSRIFANQVTYHYQCSADARLQYAFRIEPDVMPIEDDNGYLSLGNIPLDGRLAVLLEFLVHPITPGVARVYLSQGQLTTEIPLHPDPTFTAPLHLSQQIRANSQTDDEPPKVIIQALSKITLYRMQHRAQQDVQNGNFDAATRRLKHLATHLLAQGEHHLARQVLKEATNLNGTHALTDSGQKSIKYGTRSLLLPAKTEGNVP
ncbi:MAG: VWA domain-containing protein [Anaerolineales bacterium]